MTASMLHRYEREQGRLLLASLPNTSHIEAMPDIDLTALLSRMDTQRIARQGSR